MHKNYSLIFLLALTFFTSCNNDDTATQPAPVTIVDIQITDTNGSDLRGVEVSLYRTQADWVEEKNPVQTATTASNGLAKFNYLTDSVYYVNAVSGNLSNWENNFRISGIQDGKSHFVTLKLGEYKSNMISSAQGKSWRVHAYKVNGVDITNDSANACITDNSWIFFKGNRSSRFELHENALNCSPDSAAVVSGSWQIPAEGLTLKLPENGQVVTYTLHHLSPAAIRISKIEGSDLIEYTLVNP